jgi:hypothetical protein
MAVSVVVESSVICFVQTAAPVPVGRLARLAGGLNDETPPLAGPRSPDFELWQRES